MEIRRIQYVKKHYYSEKTSTKTEYEFYMGGKKVHETRSNRPFNHVGSYKKYVAKKFDVNVNDINVDKNVKRYNH